MLQPLVHGPAAPFGLSLFLCHICPAIFFGKRDQALGRIGVAVEDDVFTRNAQFVINVIIDIELPGVDDRHIKSGGNCMVQED